jgi:hypothetical protein
MCSKGLIRTRHFGLFANRRRAASLLRSHVPGGCRQCGNLRIDHALAVAEFESWKHSLLINTVAGFGPSITVDSSCNGHSQGLRRKLAVPRHRNEMPVANGAFKLIGVYSMNLVGAIEHPHLGQTVLRDATTLFRSIFCLCGIRQAIYAADS